MPGQEQELLQVVQRGRIRTLSYRSDRVVARCRVRYRTLSAILIAILLTGVSVTTHLAAQVVTWPSEELSAANGRGPDLLNMGVNTVHETGARWSGALPDQDRAISLEPVYCGEVFTNARGGISTNGATQYQALLNLPMTFDFEAMCLPVPGKFFLLAQNTHGRGLTEDFVGDTLVLSNIDSFDNIMRVGEYWWELGLLDGALIVRLGKQNVDSEIMFVESAADFVQSSFTVSPNANLPSYPNQAMAAVALVQLDEAWQLKAGVWNALARGGSWGFSGDDEVFVVGELEYRYALADGALPGTLSAGAGYLSGGEVSGESFSAVHGYSVQLEQLVYRECACNVDNVQGLAVFTAYYPRFPGSTVFKEAIGDSFTAGLVYTGIIPQRDEDVLGAGVAWAELFQGGTNHETVLELFYKAAITPRTSLQPDLQYIATPSGIHADAFVVGVRLEVIL
jgi:porin